MPKKEKNVLSLPFKWTALEYEYFSKSADWLWMICILTIGIFITAVILGNFLFGVLALVSGFAIVIFSVKRPASVVFTLSGRGVQIGHKLYPYNELESFWVHYAPPFKKIISLKSKKFFMPYLKIPLGDTDPNVVRDLLIKFIKEKEHEESFIDILMKIFKF